MFYWQYFNRFIFNEKRNSPDVSFRIQFWMELIMWLIGAMLVIVTVYLYCKEIWRVDDQTLIIWIMIITGLIMLIIVMITNYRLLAPIFNRFWRRITS